MKSLVIAAAVIAFVLSPFHAKAQDFPHQYPIVASDGDQIGNFDLPPAMLAKINALAGTLSASNPEAMAEMKRVFWEGTEHWEAMLASRARVSGRLVLSRFTREAIAKFRDR